MYCQVLLAVLIIVIPPLQSLAQKKEQNLSGASYLVQPSRIELEVDPEDSDFYLIPAQEEKSLLFLKKTKERGKGGFFWEFIYINASLEKIWIRKYVLPYGSALLTYDYRAGSIFLLSGISEEQTYKDFIIFDLDLKKGSKMEYNVDMAFPIELSEFEVLGNVAIFAGYANKRSIVKMYGFSDGSNKILPGFYRRKTKLLDVEGDESVNQFNVISAEGDKNKSHRISIKSFSEKGQSTQIYALDPGENYQLYHSHFNQFRSEIHYLSGTYRPKNSKRLNGVYVAKYQQGAQDYLKYYNYSDLMNFIPQRVANPKKIPRRYSTLLHDFERRGTYGLLIGEIYSSYSTDYRSVQKFKYKHAFVIAIDENGEIIWDNNIEMGDVESNSLNQYVHALSTDNKMVMLYLNKGTFRSKFIEGNKVIEEKIYTPVKLKFEDDVLQSEDENVGGLEHWYKNNFYAHGIQRIWREDVRQQREVYYINKLRVE